MTTQQKSYCHKCDTDTTGKKFCGTCGTKIIKTEQLTTQNASKNTSKVKAEPSKKMSAKTKYAIAGGGAALVVLAGFGFGALYKTESQTGGQAPAYSASDNPSFGKCTDYMLRQIPDDFDRSTCHVLGDGYTSSQIVGNTLFALSDNPDKPSAVTDDQTKKPAATQYLQAIDIASGNLKWSSKALQMPENVDTYQNNSKLYAFIDNGKAGVILAPTAYDGTGSTTYLYSFVDEGQNGENVNPFQEKTLSPGPAVQQTFNNMVVFGNSGTGGGAQQSESPYIWNATTGKSYESIITNPNQLILSANTQYAIKKSDTDATISLVNLDTNASQPVPCKSSASMTPPTILGDVIFCSNTDDYGKSSISANQVANGASIDVSSLKTSDLSAGGFNTMVMDAGRSPISFISSSNNKFGSLKVGFTSTLDASYAVTQNGTTKIDSNFNISGISDNGVAYGIGHNDKPIKLDLNKPTQATPVQDDVIDWKSSEQGYQSQAWKLSTGKDATPTNIVISMKNG